SKHRQQDDIERLRQEQFGVSARRFRNAIPIRLKNDASAPWRKTQLARSDNTWKAVLLPTPHEIRDNDMQRKLTVDGPITSHVRIDQEIWQLLQRVGHAIRGGDAVGSAQGLTPRAQFTAQ